LGHIVKVFSVVLVFGLSLIPFKGHVAARPAPPAPSSAAVSAVIVTPSTTSLKLDGQTASNWAALQRAWQAEFDAAQAKEAADADADAAAAAAAARQAAASVQAAPRGGGTPPAAAPRPSSGFVQDLIRQAFAGQGQTAVDWGLRVAACESGYNPNAYNPDGASGVFQFMPGTFRGTPYGSQNIFDATANVDAAAWYFQRYGGGAWSCK